jgi:hypothetical protein
MCRRCLPACEAVRQGDSRRARAMMKGTLLLALASAVDSLPAAPRRQLGESCDPMTTPVWSGITPTPLEVFGFELGTEPV